MSKLGAIAYRFAVNTLEKAIEVGSLPDEINKEKRRAIKNLFLKKAHGELTEDEFIVKVRKVINLTADKLEELNDYE